MKSSLDSNIPLGLTDVVVFVVLILIAFFLDLFAHRGDRAVDLKSAAIWSIFWVLISLAFALYLYVEHGLEYANLFLAGYALEKVLSVDNLFVIMAIFAWFQVPDGYRHRVLYWGVVGAIVFRLIFVAIGTGLLSLGVWVEILFALIILWTAIMMCKKSKDEEEIQDYSNHLANRTVRKFFPVSPVLVGHSFFIKSDKVEKETERKGVEFTVRKGAVYATPLFLCLAVIELTDVMFAFDSVPAVIAVSREALIVYSAMMFAVLGLRTMYFVLEALKRYLIHLEKAVIVLLFFISFKLGLNASDHFFNHGFDITANESLLVVLVVLVLGVVASFIFPDRSA